MESPYIRPAAHIDHLTDPTPFSACSNDGSPLKCRVFLVDSAEGSTRQSFGQSGVLCFDRPSNPANKSPEPLRSDINNVATYAF